METRTTGSFEMATEMSRNSRNDRICLLTLFAVCCLVAAAGCGVSAASVGPSVKRVPVSGAVKIGGAPLADVEVTFTPYGDNRTGQLGTGVTDEKGEFEVTNHRGQSGLPPGNYIVTASLIRPPDGAERPWPDKPAQSPAYQVIPEDWHHLTKAGRHNQVIVPDDGRTDFQIKIPKKK